MTGDERTPSEPRLTAGQRAGALQVFAHTSPFRPGPRFYRSATIQLQPPSSDTKVLVGAAVAGLRSIYVLGYQLTKAGVMLLDLAGMGLEQRALDFGAPGPTRSQNPLMEVMNRINGRWAKLRCMSPAPGMPKVESGCRMREELQTPRYTTALGSCRLRMPTCEGSEGVIVKRIHSNIYTYIYIYLPPLSCWPFLWLSTRVSCRTTVPPKSCMRVRKENPQQVTSAVLRQSIFGSCPARGCSERSCIAPYDLALCQL